MNYSLINIIERRILTKFEKTYKMKLRNILIAAALLLVVIACDESSGIKEKGVRISGKIENPEPTGIIVLESLNKNSFEVLDTIALEMDSTFHIAREVSEGNLYRLRLYNKQAVFFILNPTDESITVNVGQNIENGYEVNGSKDTDDFMDIQKTAAEMQNYGQQFMPQLMQAQQAGNQNAVDSLQAIVLEKQRSIREDVKTKITGMGTSVAAILSTQLLDPSEDIDFLKKLASKFKREAPDSKMAAQFISQIDKLSVTAVGAMAPEIDLPTPEGNNVKLSSLRGNYVMVDFWAAWCGPCRKENPNVLKAYNKYHDRGFEVYGVSLDKTKEKWVAAIAKDGLTWTQVSDLQYFNSVAAAAYGVTSIPATVLIDREGKIIAKNLRGAALEDKLAEIFKN